MSLFRRNRAAADPLEEGPAGIDDTEPEEVEADDEESAPVVVEEAADRSQGPWDESEAEVEGEGYIDLGAVALRLQPGMELRLEVEEASGRVTSATVQVGGSAVQLQAFAAPRHEGIWTEIREEIAASIVRQGGVADDVPGVFGRELLARVPVRTPDGRTSHQAVRFTGVDGPRWFLRAVFHGVAAYEAEAAAVLEAVVRSVVVRRGGDAMAPRDLLSLRLPDAEPDAPAEPQAPALDPFTRGPEITEIR
ncbi:MAG: DUF3710 domain-containing protein [Kineosporiaceae bacterium]